MLSNIDFKTEYLSWLQSNTEIIKLNHNTTRLTSPFLDFNNDHIEIYISYCDKNLFLSDGGETISNLELSNFRFRENGKRDKILKELISAYSVSITDSDELTISCTYENFPQRANQLMQCMIKVSDMLMLSENTITTIFAEDVRSYFDSNDIIYTHNVNLLGKSTFYTRYEFVLPKFRNKPERFVTTINYMKENIVKSTLFSWDDIRQSRDDDSVLFAVVNDLDKEISSSGISALKEYGIQYIPWSEREKHIEDFKTA